VKSGNLSGETAVPAVFPAPPPTSFDFPATYVPPSDNVAFSPDGNSLAIASDNVIRVWIANSGWARKEIRAANSSAEPPSRPTTWIDARSANVSGSCP
jgi:WD40 repeat protein